MRIKVFARLLLPLFSLISLVACGAGVASPTAIPAQTLPATTVPEVQATATPTQTPVITGEGACANNLFPAVNGATWSYAGTGGPAGPYAYTDTITDVRPDGFTISSTFDDNLTRTQQWKCTPEGLVALQLPGAAAAITSQGMQAQFETSNVQGVTLPSTVNPGDKWSFSLDMGGNGQVSGITAQTSGHAVYNFTAGNIESVTVPAGKFDAMRIEGDLSLDMTATVSGTAIPFKVTMHTTSWFAPGVGLVKTNTTADVVGMPVNDTLELQSYHIR